MNKDQLHKKQETLLKIQKQTLAVLLLLLLLLAMYEYHRMQFQVS